MSAQIFISYRREDASSAAGRLCDRLSARFSHEKVFIDVEDIGPGIPFPEEIKKNLEACDVLIAVIGRHWLTALDEGGRRQLDNPKDFVRTEIRTALKRGIRVIPVLVDGALNPRSADLPEELEPLAHRQALTVSHDRFWADADRLIGAVERALENARVELQRKDGGQEWLQPEGREQAERLGLERRQQEEDARLRAKQCEIKRSHRAKKLLQLLAIIGGCVVILLFSLSFFLLLLDKDHVLRAKAATPSPTALQAQIQSSYVRLANWDDKDKKSPPRWNGFLFKYPNGQSLNDSAFAKLPPENEELIKKELLGKVLVAKQEVDLHEKPDLDTSIGTIHKNEKVKVIEVRIQPIPRTATKHYIQIFLKVEK